jgi:hypothetical protein
MQVLRTHLLPATCPDLVPLEALAAHCAFITEVLEYMIFEIFQIREMRLFFVIPVYS